MSHPLSWSLFSGPLPILLWITAALALIFLGRLVTKRLPRRLMLTVSVVALLGTATAVALLAWIVDDVWRPFPEALPIEVLGWLGVAILGIGLGIAAIWKTARRCAGTHQLIEQPRRLHGRAKRSVARREAAWQIPMAILAAVAMVLAGLNQVNRFYGYYPTTEAALGLALPQEAPLPPFIPGTVASSTQSTPAMSPSQADGTATSANGSPAAGPRSSTPSTVTTSAPTPPPNAPSAEVTPPPAPPTPATWVPPVDLPKAGTLTQVDIPGTTSGFAARQGWVYLPPAYLTANRPLLPVLMLIPGQPGDPRDWLNGGQAAATMDAYAAAHKGLAPIVVMPDPLGSTTANPLCADTAFGKSDTYLTQDVPAWISQHIQANPDTSLWAVGGFSFGGTCSVQLAAAHPKLFPTFLDISGQDAPTLGTKKETIDKAFAGDVEAYAKVNPIDLFDKAAASLATSPYIGMVGLMGIGEADHTYGPELRKVRAAAESAGVKVATLQVAGAHDWYVASAALSQAMPWLGGRMGLTGPVPLPAT
ncbi:alpha/beta fold hydrolase [Nakamurella antarctica]|uniref:Alpha/beta fold hydrolase n=1 Tax=Nakamurella antarctica TaxID=1902245 RepID=A0A3G8ZLY4_9ACTN|nr:alpha/beta hydrolase-fold protein [Nakamurella antarctica]AZI58362.1 alpha/beta fold hydrolase [Nakamurella antarctica]